MIESAKALTSGPSRPAVPQDCRAGVARLDRNWPLKDTPPRRWVVFVNDCQRFVERGGVERAAALQWNALDLFGCDPHAPFARIDRQGLLWIQNGRRIVKFEAMSATIGCGKGIMLAYRRGTSMGRVLPWDIL